MSDNRISMHRWRAADGQTEFQLPTHDHRPVSISVLGLNPTHSPVPESLNGWTAEDTARLHQEYAGRPCDVLIKDYTFSADTGIVAIRDIRVGDIVECWYEYTD